MLFSTAIVLLSSVVIAFTRAIPSQPVAPAGYWSGLEEYSQYHSRYMALECFDQHNTSFFQNCCHPLLKGQKVKPECDPANDCEDNHETKSSAHAHSKSVPAPAATSKPATPVNVAPDPSNDDATTDNSEPTTTTSKSSPKPTSSSPKNSSGGGVQTGTGDGTFFFQKGNPGACGQVHDDNEKIVALDIGLYGNGCNGQSPHCGKTVTITNTQSGDQVNATVADCCPTCNSFGSIDMSIGAFTKLATQDQGLIPISWILH